MRIIDKNYLLIKLAKTNAQALTEYIMITSLIFLLVVNMVKVFGPALDVACGLAIYNMTGHY